MITYLLTNLKQWMMFRQNITNIIIVIISTFIVRLRT